MSIFCASFRNAREASTILFYLFPASTNEFDIFGNVHVFFYPAIPKCLNKRFFLILKLLKSFQQFTMSEERGRI